MHSFVKLGRYPEFKIGIIRTFLSGDFSNNGSPETLGWSELDAIKLVFEPVFGSSKKS